MDGHTYGRQCECNRPSDNPAHEYPHHFLEISSCEDTFVKEQDADSIHSHREPHQHRKCPRSLYRPSESKQTRKMTHMCNYLAEYDNGFRVNRIPITSILDMSSKTTKP